MFNKPVNAKSIGYLLLLLGVFVLLTTALSLIFIPAFGLASGGSIFLVIPFIFFMLFIFSLSGICIYIALRYLKGKPFKENESLGKALVIFSTIYLAYTSLICLISNLTGNYGGFAQPIFAFLLFLILFPIGLGLRNGYKKI